MARNQKLSYKMNMFHFLTKQNYSKYSQTSVSMSFSSSEASTIFGRERLFEGGRLFEGSVYFKIRDFRGAFIRGGRLFEAGRLFEEIRYGFLTIPEVEPYFMITAIASDVPFQLFLVFFSVHTGLLLSVHSV